MTTCPKKKPCKYLREIHCDDESSELIISEGLVSHRPLTLNLARIIALWFQVLDIVQNIDIRTRQSETLLLLLLL